MGFNNTHSSNKDTLHSFKGMVTGEVAVVFPVVELNNHPAEKHRGATVESEADGLLYKSDGAKWVQIIQSNVLRYYGEYENNTAALLAGVPVGGMYSLPIQNPGDVFLLARVKEVLFSLRFGIGNIPDTEEDVLQGSEVDKVHNLNYSVIFDDENYNLLWFAEPISEPIKTKWYTKEFNEGLIEEDGLFFYKIINDWRVYFSNYPTIISDPNVVLFKIN